MDFLVDGIEIPYVFNLTNLGLLERPENGGVICPYALMHIDMYMKAA